MLFILLFLSFFISVGTFVILNGNQDNGKVVNYTGIVRGSSQRIVKLYLLGEPMEELITNIEKIMDGLAGGSKELGIPKPKNAEYKNKINSTKKFWTENMLPILQGDAEEENTAQLLKNSEEFFTLADEAAKFAEEFTVNGITVLKIVSIVTFILNFICIATIARIIQKKILTPIKAIERGMMDFAKGNLSTNIEFRADNELGHLADSIRRSIDTSLTYIRDIDRAMYEMSTGNFDLEPSQPFVGDFKNIEESITKFIMNISDTFGNLRLASNQVQVGSEQVCTVAQVLAEGATEQAGSIERLSVSITEAANQVNQNAQDSLKAREMATATSAAVISSNEQMQNLKATMDNINEKSREINEIINTIKDIAFQTNILALNAAIEAARAGEAGKGFAVVADEVRVLASKSANAAKKTEELIAVSVSAINEGVVMTDETAVKLRAIVEDTDVTTQMISNISKASSEQASILTDLSTNINKITSVIHNNSAISEESAAASQELFSQADLMEEFISKFKYKSQAVIDESRKNLS